MPPVGSPNQVLPAASRMMPSQKVGMAQAISEKVKRANIDRGLALPACQQTQGGAQNDRKHLPQGQQQQGVAQLGDQHLADRLAQRPGDAQVAARPLAQCVQELVGEDRLVQAELGAQGRLCLGRDADVAPDHRPHRVARQHPEQEEIHGHHDCQGDQREDDFAQQVITTVHKLLRLKG